MDFNQLSQEAMALVGLVTLVAAMVQLGKKAGVVKDGDAAKWGSGISTLAMCGLAIATVVFGVDLESEAAEQVLSALRLVGDLVLVVLGPTAAFNMARAIRFRR